MFLAPAPPLSEEKKTKEFASRPFLPQDVNQNKYYSSMNDDKNVSNEEW